MKVGKKRKEAEAKYDNTKSYTLLEACNILKQISTTKFDASVDIDVRLGVDPRQANQMVRGVASLPHGLGMWCALWCFVLQTKRKKPKQRVQITLVWTIILKRLQAVGPISTSSLPYQV